MTPAETPAPAEAELVSQPHGGALRRGGTNRGGPGRPPGAIRRGARDLLEPLLPKLNQIARSRTSTNADKIRAIDALGRIAMNERSVTIEDVKAALKAQTSEMFEFLPRDQAEALIARLKPIWYNL